MAKVSVLIVDDSRTVQLIVVGVLAEHPDFVVVGTAGSAAQAEWFFGRGRIDAVTLDVEMPGAGGLDYVRTLARRAIPVVLVSTRIAKGDQVRAEALRRGGMFPQERHHRPRRPVPFTGQGRAPRGQV